jgi:hypothetical protein
MSNSETLDIWAASMFAVQRDLQQPGKDAKGQVRGRQDYRYLSLPALIDHLKPVLREHSLFFSQDTTKADGGTDITTTVWTAAGPQWVTFGPLFIPHASDAQAAGSAITYGRRYHLTAVFGLAAEDDDGSSARGDADDRTPQSNQGRSLQVVEDVGGEAAADGEDAEAEPPTKPKVSDKQRWMDEWHPGKPHRMKQSTNAPTILFCATRDDQKCPYTERVAKGVKVKEETDA